MMLRDAVNDYIAWRRAHGAKFDSGARLLYLFLEHVDGSIGCDTVVQADVLDFLAGNEDRIRGSASIGSSSAPEPAYPRSPEDGSRLT